MRTSTLLASVLLVVLLPATGMLSPAQPIAGAAPPPSGWGDGSLLFVENVGQFHPEARFQVRGSNATLWLAEDGLWITLAPALTPPSAADAATLSPLPSDGRGERAREWGEGVALRLSFPGANLHPRPEPFARQETVVNYYRGNDPDRWYTHVPVWSGVRYVDLYPGVDLEIIGRNGHLAWRLVARQAPRAISDVRLRVEGAAGIAVEEGRLRLSTAAGEFTLPLLQVVSADGALLDVGEHPPTVQADEILFPFASAPRPAGSLDALSFTALLYSTYLGGGDDDWGYGIAVDADGAAYVTGDTQSTDFPTVTGSFDTSHNGASDVFIAKLSADGSSLTYATFLGGGINETGWGIAVDASGAAYVTGETDSNDFPTTPGAYDRSYSGSHDAFVAKLSADGGSLVYATYLGGWNPDRSYDIAVDASGAAYVTGNTGSSTFPTTAGAYDRSYNGGGEDAFVTKLSADGSSLVYSTFLGGSVGANTKGTPYGRDLGHSIAVDASGAAYVTGYTWSTDFPTTPGAFDRSHNEDPGGYTAYDAFVTKLSADGSSLVYSTYLGGGYWDEGFGIAVDAGGAAYVTGHTWSTNFPTTGGVYDESYNGNYDAFVTKLSADGSSLVYSTYLGGNDNSDTGYDIAVDADGAAYVTGETLSTDFPTTPGSFDTSFNGNSDVFITKLNTDGSSLVYSTFVGGTIEDCGRGIAVSADGTAYVTGETFSTDFPTTPGAYDRTCGTDGTCNDDGYGGKAYDAFVVAGPPLPDLSPSTKQVNPDTAVAGEVVTFTARLVNNSLVSTTASFTDTLPAALLLQGSPTSSEGTPTVNGQTITWSGTVTASGVVTITYATLLTSTTAITPTAVNEAYIADGLGNVYLRRAFVNGYYIYLPLVMRNR